MNAYELSLSLGLTGTDQEKVDTLKTITANPIRLDYLLEMLNFRGMLRKTDGSQGQERWVGTLQNLKAALIALNLTEKVTAYEMWFSHVTNPRQVTWDTRFPQWAAAFYAMELAFADQPNMPSQADFDAVVALGGGRPYKDLTTTEYAAQRTAAASLAEKQAVVTACRTSINALASKVTAVNAWLDALDLSTKTVQELQDYCDALLASETGNP